MPIRAQSTRFVQRILNSADLVEAGEVMTEAVAAIGFHGYCVGSSLPIGDNWALSPLLTNWPAADLEEYAAKQYYEIDPTLAYLRRYHTPFYWDARRPPTPESAPFCEFLLRTPIRSGVVVPLGISSGRLWVISASRSDFEEFALEALDLLPLYGHAAKCAFGHQDKHANVPTRQLSQRQLEFLSLAAEGKSSADIATITGHSRRTVDYHFAEIRRKLNVATRAQAIMDLPLLGLMAMNH
jgi:LuxR family quorum-sensing transcriptional regulator LasR